MPDIPIKGKVLFGPINQYKLFGKFPWGFFLHICIVCLDCFYLLQEANMANEFSWEQRMVWYTIFLDQGIERNDVVIDRTRAFYNLDDLLTQVTSSLDFYLSLQPELTDLGDELTDETYAVNNQL